VNSEFVRRQTSNVSKYKACHPELRVMRSIHRFLNYYYSWGKCEAFDE